MSCMIAMLQGGSPAREIFPISIDQVTDLQNTGASAIFRLLGVKGLADLAMSPTQYVGAALRPDGSPFYLTTIAPDLGRSADPVGRWRGGFFAPFGVADVVGVVEGDLAAPGKMPTSIQVQARLMLDVGGESLNVDPGRSARVSVDWEVHGNQATRPNKAAIISYVKVIDPGPHLPDDIRRCVALHAPQRSFGEARAIVAMQCGVAAACMLEAIC